MNLQGVLRLCLIATAFVQVSACGGGSGGGTAAATPLPPATSRFVPTASMSTARSYHSATRLQNGTVLVSGGIDATGQPVTTAEIFDPATDTFKPTGKMVAARAYHAAALLQDGRVAIFGGH